MTIAYIVVIHLLQIMNNDFINGHSSNLLRIYIDILLLGRHESMYCVLELEKRDKKDVYKSPRKE